MQESLPDVQSSQDPRGIFLDWVGVQNVKIPIMVSEMNGNHISVIATANLFASLCYKDRGAHMSRFAQTLYSYCYGTGSLGMNPWPYEWIHEFAEKCLAETIKTQKASRAYISLTFLYPISLTAPKSGFVSYSFPEILLEGVKEHNITTFRLAISHYVTTLCPCSKELCEKNAHNQRAKVTVRVVAKAQDLPMFEEIITLINMSASSPIYNVLKRADEKFVTEKMYENPRFVEDVAREFALSFVALKRIGIIGRDIKVISEESIHNHDAVAYLQYGDIHI